MKMRLSMKLNSFVIGVVAVFAPNTKGFGGSLTSIVSPTGADSVVCGPVSTVISSSRGCFRGDEGRCRFTGLNGLSSAPRFDGLELRNTRGLIGGCFTTSVSFGGSGSVFISVGLLGRPNLNSLRNALAGVRSSDGPLNVDGVLGKPNRNAGLDSGFESSGFVGAGSGGGGALEGNVSDEAGN